MYLNMRLNSIYYLPNIQGMAMKFLEQFYCKNTCMLTAYWVRSPSKYSLWAALYLAKQCCHCWKHFLELLLWNSFWCCHHISWMSSISWNLNPCKADFIFGNSQKSFRVKSGEWSGCSIPALDFGLETAWQRAPCELECPSSGLFQCAASCNCFSISI